LHYQYATLRHGHPLINGFSGWSTPLQDLLRQPWAPLYDYDRFAATVSMLRSLGVRYVVVHPADYNVTQLHDGELSRTVGGLRGSGQLSGEQRLMGTHAFTLDPWPETVVGHEPVEPVSPAEFSIDVSSLPERIRSLVDGDNDSRWFGTGPSWIAARFARPRDLARVELQLAARSLMDYPRELQIDSEDAQGHVRTLYRSSPYPEYIAAVLRDRSYPVMRIELPRNDTTILRVRETGTHDWSVHELRLWRRP
jgi:hypothetical protein